MIIIYIVFKNEIRIWIDTKSLFSLKALPKNITLFASSLYKQEIHKGSIYSWRLLELFEQQKQINNDGYRWLKISVDDFNHAMEISEGYKKTFGLLRKKNY